MARWATECIIADIVHTGCRAILLDAHQFNTNYAGSVDWANDGSAKVQRFLRGYKGIPFGIAMVSQHRTKIVDTLNIIEGAEANNVPFNVIVTEGLYDIRMTCWPDYSVKEGYFTYQKHSEDWFEECVWRFVTHELIPEP